MPYSRAWIIATLLALAIGNAALLRTPEVRATLRRLLTLERGYLLLSEGVFTGAFALMGWLRSFTPAVVDTEKFMDVAFLSAIWRAPHLPPPDPWLAGQPINYYYFGHFLVATLAKLLATPPAIAFNTSIALIFALTAAAVCAVATNIVAAARGGARPLLRSAPFGVVSALLVLVAGNLDGARRWWQAATALAAQHPAELSTPWAWWTHRDLWLQYDWWGPSRVIVTPSNTINEFPAFSFILADLHAHVLALPFAALAIGVALNLLLARGVGLRVFGVRAAGVLSLVTAAVVFGGLYAINGWDLPTYLGLAVLALAVQQWVAHDRRWSGQFLLDLVAAAVMVGALAVLAYVPFFRNFTSPAQGIGLVPPAARTRVGDEFAIFGLPLLLLGSLLIVRLVALFTAVFSPERAQGDTLAIDTGHRVPSPTRQLVVLCIGGIVAVFVLFALRFPGSQGLTLAWVALALVGCGLVVLVYLMPGAHWRSWSADLQPPEIFMWCLVGVAVALVGTSELIYLRDVFDGGNYFRMNTVFKLYYQAWLLLGVASGPAVAWLLARLAPSQLLATVFAPRSPFLAPGAAPTAPAYRAIAVTAARASGEALLPEGKAHGTGMQPPLQAPHPLAEGASGPARPTDRRTSKRSPIQASILRWSALSGTLVWVAMVLVLLGAAAIYPVQASAARTANFSLPRSLDGTAFMATDPVDHGDAAAIAWLNVPANVPGNPVIVEASGNEYSHFDRISAFTGLPTVLGWLGHEVQWRINWLANPARAGELERRKADVDQMYTSADPQVVRALLNRYHVRYVYVGAAERQQYPAVNMSRFDAFLAVAYQHADVTIYRVR